MSGRPTAVHISLILFVVFFLVAFVIAWMNYTELGKVRGLKDIATKKADAAVKAQKKQDEEIEALKAKIGHTYSDVGVDGAPPQSVIWGADTDLALVKDLSEQTYRAGIAHLVTRVTNLEQSLTAIRADKDATHKNYLDLKAIHEQINRDFESQTAEKAKELQARITKHNEELSTLQTRVNELQKDNNLVRSELEDEIQAHIKDNKRYQQEIRDYIAINERLQDKLDAATKISFENPDGKITWVDNLSRRVWIDLGASDYLRKRVSFSVYIKDNRGVGRGPEDIKGAIEVTRIIDAHTAECRILDDELFRPISKGDPVYSPLWSPGRKEVFTFVGQIDLDRDGVNDRDELHDLIKANGGEIDNEVLNNGQRIRYSDFSKDLYVPWEEDGPGIDVRTKFLVVGEIPDPSKFSKQEDIDRVQRIMVHHRSMREEARKQGVRVVSLNDFLSWMGYRPQRRLFQPGKGERPYTLKFGAHSTATNGYVGDRSATGQTSKLYGNKRKLKPSASTGQTSGRFSGGK